MVICTVHNTLPILLFFFKKRLRKEECIRKIKSINLFNNKEYYKSIQKYISVQNDKHT